MNMDRLEVEKAFKVWRNAYNEYWLDRFACPLPASAAVAVFKGITGIDVYQWFTPPVNSDVASKIRAMAGEHGHAYCKAVIINME